MSTTAPKIIITGTGRAGTTLLVQLLTELGLDTGYTSATWRKDYFEHCSAGLEHEIEDPRSPVVVKSPELSATLPAVLARGHVTIAHALIPVRDLDAATRSRVRIGGDGRTPGGLRGTRDPVRQKAMLAENFHTLVHTLVTHEIPHTFLDFPRFATDGDYAFEKLGFLAPALSREEFRTAFDRVARPELIHEFNRSTPMADAGAPARDHLRKRRRRRARRWLGWSAAAAALVWLFAVRHPAVSAPTPGTEVARPVSAVVATPRPLPASVARARRLFAQPALSPRSLALAASRLELASALPLRGGPASPPAANARAGAFELFRLPPPRTPPSASP